MRSAVDLKRLAVFVAIGLTVAAAWWAIGAGTEEAGDATTGAGASSPVQAAALVEPPRATGQDGLQVGFREGDLAQDFEASDLDGNRFRLSDYRGQAVLLNFWASWCTSCRAEMPAMQTVLDDHRADGFAIVAVNMGDTPARASRYLEDLLVDFDVAMDPELEVAKRYRVVGLPTSVFIDRDGVVRRSYAGEMSLSMIETFVDEVLGASASSATGSATVPYAAAPAPADREPAVLFVTPDVDGPNSMLLQSPSLRCTADFCAGYLLQDLRATPGITNANSRVIDQSSGAWGFVIKYDPVRLTAEEIIDVYQRSLTEHPDPLYPAPHEVKSVQAKR